MTRAERERTLNAVLFFVANTRECTERKLFSLLYLLDVACFQQTGQRVTGLSYATQKSGPCPHTLKVLLEDLQGEFGASLRRETSYTKEKPRQIFLTTGAAAFDGDMFTDRHLALMSGLAQRFNGARGREIDVSQFDHGAFTRARGRGPEEEIRFEETVSEDDPHRLDILAIAHGVARRRAHMAKAA